jgi:hypothetical protein
MREVEDQYLKAMLDQKLTLIKTASVENIVIEAQELAKSNHLQKLKLQSQETFTFTDSSFTVASDQMEKTSELSKEDRNDLKADRQR